MSVQSSSKSVKVSKKSGSGASSKQGSRTRVTSSPSKVSSENLKINKPNTEKLVKSKSKSNVTSKSKVLGIGDVNFGEVAQTTMDVVGTVGKLASGDVAEILNIPNTLMKVVNTTSNVISDLKKNNIPVPEKVVTLSNEDVSKSRNSEIMSEVKKFIPVVNMSSIPSSYANSVSIPPLVRKDGVLKNGQRFVNITGSNVSSLPVTYNAVGTFFNTYANRVHPTIGTQLFGTRLETISQTFQKWRLNKFVIQYIPVQKTSEPGAVYMTVRQGTDLTTYISESTMSQNELFSMNTAYTSGSLVVPGNSGWYYTKVDAVTDQKFFTNWAIFIGTQGNTSAVVPAAGQLLFHFDIDFCAPIALNFNYYDDLVQSICLARLAYAPTDLSFRDFIRLGLKILKQKDSISEKMNHKRFSTLNNIAKNLVMDPDCVTFMRENKLSINLLVKEMILKDVSYEKYTTDDSVITWQLIPAYERLFTEVLTRIGPMAILMNSGDDFVIESNSLLVRLITFILDRYDRKNSDPYNLSDDSDLSESEDELSEIIE